MDLLQSVHLLVLLINLEVFPSQLSMLYALIPVHPGLSDSPVAWALNDHLMPFVTCQFSLTIKVPQTGFFTKPF